jgi:signal peptidase II
LIFNIFVGGILFFLAIFIFTNIFYHSKLKHEVSVIMRLGLVFILSGGLGNLIDKIFRGYVIDFINFSFWPAFNVADILVCAGASVVVYALYFEREE